jgi:hypothetical protein
MLQTGLPMGWRASVSDSAELHSFVKLAIAYLGIMAGLAVLGLGFYVAAARVESAGDLPVSADRYYAVIAFYVLLIAVSLAGLARMARRKRDGAYLAFAALVISLFAASPNQVIQSPYIIIWWLAIPNAVVGILLLKSLNTLPKERNEQSKVQKHDDDRTKAQ